LDSDAFLDDLGLDTFSFVMNDILGQPRFELRRLAEYSDEAILEELRRVAAQVPDSAFLESDFDKLGHVGRNTVRRRFGSWFKALEAAGLAHRSTDQIKTRGGHASSRMSDDEILAKLRELASKLGRSTLTQSDVIQHLPFSDQILRSRWGTIRSAFEAAGLQATNLGRRYTDEECFDNMLKVWTHLGRPPMHREMSEPPSIVGGKAYMRRFGTWNRALAAFVERVNQDGDTEDEQEADGGPASVDAPEPKTVRLPLSRSSEQSRDIRLGLRFRVLHRDRFKCVLCGDHPARNPECVLHVDHVTPWSKGGRTSENNLRTLCATCNIGRGNRFTD
jgi:predicted transcriptional regulator